jgi:hypothetical protein
MQSEIRVGQCFKFSILSDNPSEERSRQNDLDLIEKGIVFA